MFRKVEGDTVHIVNRYQVYLYKAQMSLNPFPELPHRIEWKP